MVGTIVKAVATVLGATLGSAGELEKVAKECKKAIRLPAVPVKVPSWDKKFWNDIGGGDGWKIQQHMTTNIVRIVDNDGTLRACGTEEAMEELFHKLIKNG
ncbi:MAG: hypothetical protein IJ644_06845 [Oscillospiraceae bacterium]|nr:hypothetical protein [Oscillospiraceae bacterium]